MPLVEYEIYLTRRVLPHQCEYCAAAKENPYGMCSGCGKFPRLNTRLVGEMEVEVSEQGEVDQETILAYAFHVTGVSPDDWEVGNVDTIVSGL